ncbi:MAG: methyltransferase [Gemmatimonadota bacterium]|nr:MAG: methyltransferase [Gemmatimonadota bacterium]
MATSIPTDGLKIRRVPLTQLHLDPSNARSHPEQNLESIVASLSRFGQAEPLIVQKSTARIIGGNGRFVAMKKLGWTECDIVELEVDDLTATGLGIALNRTGELAAWDEPVLAKLLGDLRTENALDGVGFDTADIDALLDELSGDIEPGDVDDAGPGEPPADPVSKVGDLWILGDHRLLCGDSTIEDDVARLLNGETATLMATDPPYLVDYSGGNHPQSWHNAETTRDKTWDDYVDPDASVTFFADFLRIALDHLTLEAPIYQWHATRRQSLVEAAWEQNGLLLHQTIVWVKARSVLTRSHFMWRSEPAFYGWRKGNQPGKTRRPPANQPNVWEIDQRGESDGIHPTQKPRTIFAWPMQWHTRPGETVYEPFSGSGTQIIAAEETRRRCCAMEISPQYVDVDITRWQQATGKQATLDGDGRTFDEIATERGAGKADDDARPAED